MGKIAVKLSHPEGKFSDDSGVPFVPHETRVVEDTQRIKDAIAIRVLERDRENDPKEAEKGKAEKSASAVVASDKV